MHKCGRTADGDRLSRIPLREFSIDRRRCDAFRFSSFSHPLFHLCFAAKGKQLLFRESRLPSATTSFRALVTFPLLSLNRGVQVQELQAEMQFVGEEGRREMFPPPPPSMFSFFCSPSLFAVLSPPPKSLHLLPSSRNDIERKRNVNPIALIDTCIYIPRFEDSFAESVSF